MTVCPPGLVETYWKGGLPHREKSGYMAQVMDVFEDAMTAVRERMADFGGPASFRDLVADCPDRIHVVVRFLAILELYREGKVELQQGPTFGEIEVEWNA